MKVLSIRQPWGWAVAEAGKCIENRSRRDGGMPQPCHHRGKLLLHVSGSMTGEEYYDAADMMQAAGLIRRRPVEQGPAPVLPPRSQLPLGGIIGICDVIGHLTPDGWLIVRHGVRHAVRPDERNKLRISSCSELLDLRWWGGGYALVLDNVRPLPFIKCPGNRGLWNAPRDVLERIAA